MRTRPALIAMLLAATTLAWAQDTDGDGLSDATEKLLLTDPNFAETLEVVAELPTYTPTPERPARYDLTRVRFGNVAHGRWLWALEFAEPYSFENASIILYVDADNNPATGREGMGCETTYGHRNGAPTQMFYLPEGPARRLPAAAYRAPGGHTLHLRRSAAQPAGRALGLPHEHPLRAAGTAGLDRADAREGVTTAGWRRWRSRGVIQERGGGCDERYDCR